jgi:hypothetical protein
MDGFGGLFEVISGGFCGGNKLLLLLLESSNEGL